MYYKLNKNLMTTVFALFIVLNTVQISNAQGVVSLVDEDDSAFSDELFSDDSADTEPANTDSKSLDTELPNTLSEDDVIPLDNSLLSPADSEDTETENNSNSDKKGTEDVEENEEEDDDEFNLDSDFSLGLNTEATEDKKVSNNPLMVKPDSSKAAPKAVPENIEEEDDEEEPVTGLFAAPANNSGNSPLAADKFGNSVLGKIDNELFNQMSDIEKQTTLLTLELRREKIRSEIEAIRAQRKKAERERIQAEEEEKRKEFEWKKEQEAKVLREQQALKEKEIELEKLKQKKMLNAYMNQMLQQNQKWIDENALLHKKMRKIEEDRKNLATDFKEKLDNLTLLSNKTTQAVETAKNNHDRTVASLTAQNVQLKKRIEADAAAAKAREANPFEAGGRTVDASGQVIISDSNSSVDLAKEYAVMEIIGKGDDLAARLINKDGDSFLVRKGLTLHTGHTVDEITERYVRFDKDDLKSYLYSAGSAVGGEPQRMEASASAADKQQTKSKASAKPVAKKSTPRNSERGIPSLGTGMFIK